MFFIQVSGREMPCGLWIQHLLTAASVTVKQKYKQESEHNTYWFPAPPFLKHLSAGRTSLQKRAHELNLHIRGCYTGHEHILCCNSFGGCQPRRANLVQPHCCQTWGTNAFTYSSQKLLQVFWSKSRQNQGVLQQYNPVSMSAASCS